MPSPVVYAAAPLGQRTAGPEAITQFVDALRRRGVEAHLIPMRTYRGRRNDPEYDIYDHDVVERIANPDDAVLVIPEISPIESQRELREVPRDRTWLGWFSVSNCPDPRARYFRPSERCCATYPPGYVPDVPPVPADFGLGRPVEPGPFATWREARSRQGGGLSGLRAAAVDTVSMRFARRIIDDPDVSFFAQSYFAQGFVREVLGREAMIITDPIREMPRPDVPRARSVVAYNVVKSGTMIGEVARLMPEVEFLPIEGMSAAEVQIALAGATAYLELGHLPGRDRMPREAASLGTPVVVLARGAGYCWADVPLPVAYRIPFREGWPQVAAQALRAVIGNPQQAIADQEEYRGWVAGERTRYEQAIDAWVSVALN